MRWLEPKALGVLTTDAKTTVEITVAIFGTDKEVVHKRKKDVFEALLCLEDDGAIESRLCYDDHKRPVCYWALRGGTFPENIIDKTPYRHRRRLRHQRGSA